MSGRYTYNDASVEIGKTILHALSTFVYSNPELSEIFRLYCKDRRYKLFCNDLNFYKNDFHCVVGLNAYEAHMIEGEEDTIFVRMQDNPYKGYWTIKLLDDGNNFFMHLGKFEFSYYYDNEIQL